MNLNSILPSERIQTLRQALNRPETILIEELWNAPKALIAALAQSATNKRILILTGAGQEEIRLYHDLAFFAEHPVIDFPSWETLPSENIAPSPDIVGERYAALKQILSREEPCIILSGLQACLQRLIEPKIFSQMQFTLEQGQTISFQELILRFIGMGYQRRPVASDKGEFAVRGGIIDVFPVSSPEPFRLEFWGDELESLRIYDPISQKSIKPIEKIELLPAQELELLQAQTKQSTILDYLGPDTLIIFDDLLALENRYASLISLGENNPYFCSIEEFLNQLLSYQKIFWTSKPIEELSEIKFTNNSARGFYSSKSIFTGLSFQMFNRDWNVQRWRHPFNTITGFLFEPEEDPSNDEILSKLSSLAPESELHFLCANETEKNGLQKKLHDTKVNLPSSSHFHLKYLSSGFVVDDLALMVFPLTELTHRYKIRRPKLRSNVHSAAVETFDLVPGDIVVHLNNGIGRYLGLEKRPNHLGIFVEFLIIEYADHSKLYVPFNQAHLVTKYIGGNEEAPKLSTLGNNRWKKTKESTERSILGYAAELLKSYATRTFTEGYAYPADEGDVQTFEDEFPYVETDDQITAVQAIKQDMMSNKVMDRLICGDVGYGKTEVAMRAAFKAVADGRKQVAVLVPTTILAMQHYENFVERMRDFPINIGVLSRFRTAKQISETLKGIENGSVDIVIGTHRLISQDVKFKELGLVIIDEEQRFGVKAKEHLKKIKVGVDCLTLSATPIPRTLYMSLIGARDMSVINTPPQDRLPIKTVLVDANDQIMKNAILRELARDGQVFFIHNRVETIYGVADRLKKLLPQVRLIIAHGQMSSDEIDSAFHAFKSGQADILVATTIVENGIDIPNANTILIDRADMFGLATLYQLRGRVGRWNRRAYAYFMVPNLTNLSEMSRKRLAALAESSGYGAGMKLAMRDLEIRGAGDILGTEQSGHVSSIGFHLYCKFLKRTIKTLQGEISSVMTDPRIDFAVDARLTEEYIFEISLRLEVYQRLGEAASWEELEDLWIEIVDRFGPPPEMALYLYHLTRIRIYAALNSFTLVKQERLSLTLEKQKGKESTIRKILMPKFKTPQEFESKVIAELERTT